MKQNARAARRYARALIQLMQSDDEVVATDEGLTLIEHVLDDNPEIHAFMVNPALDIHERHSVLDPVLDKAGSPTLGKFLKVLLDARRLDTLRAIREQFHELALERLNVAEAEILSAVPLTQFQEQRLTQALGKRFGRKIKLRVAVDPAVIGGMRVSVAGTQLDGTVRTALTQMKMALTEA